MYRKHLSHCSLLAATQVSGCIMDYISRDTLHYHEKMSNIRAGLYSYIEAIELECT